MNDSYSRRSAPIIRFAHQSPGLRERLDQLELWVARLDARLAETASPPKPAAGGGLDPWQAALAAVLASASSAALALAVSRALG